MMTQPLPIASKLPIKTLVASIGNYQQIYNSYLSVSEHIAHSLTDNYFVVSSTVGNVGLCNPAHLIGLWLECMACTLGDCSTTSSIKLLNTTLLYLVA